MPFPGTSISALLGLTFAGVSTSSSNPTFENKKRGFELEAKTGAMANTQKLALDATMGWSFSQIYGNEAPGLNPQNNLPDREKITTAAANIALQGWYRFFPEWMAGPLMQIRFGTDSSFSPYPNDPHTPRVFLGLKIAQQQFGKAGTPRFSAFAMSDVSIPQRNVLIAGAGVDFVLPLVHADIVVQEKVVTVDRVVQHERFIHTLDGSLVNFETSSAKLLPRSIEFLKKLSTALTENPAVWGHLEIQGHTDSRGDPHFNLKLSQMRALSVQNALQLGGVPAEKLSAVGLGSTIPLVSETSDMDLARNRRVELIFENVSNPEKLSQIIERARRESHIPESCGDETCK